MSCFTTDKTKSESPLCPAPAQAPPPPPSLPMISHPAKMMTQSWALPPMLPWKQTKLTLKL